MTTVQNLIDQARQAEETPFLSVGVEVDTGGIIIVNEDPHEWRDEIQILKQDFPKLIALMWDMLETDLQNKEREKQAIWEGAS